MRIVWITLVTRRASLAIRISAVSGFAVVVTAGCLGDETYQKRSDLIGQCMREPAVRAASAGPVVQREQAGRAMAECMSAYNYDFITGTKGCETPNPEPLWPQTYVPLCYHSRNPSERKREESESPPNFNLP
jgi:hypothetical protein